MITGAARGWLQAAAGAPGFVVAARPRTLAAVGEPAGPTAMAAWTRSPARGVLARTRVAAVIGPAIRLPAVLAGHLQVRAGERSSRVAPKPARAVRRRPARGGWVLRSAAAACVQPVSVRASSPVCPADGCTYTTRLAVARALVPGAVGPSLEAAPRSAAAGDVLRWSTTGRLAMPLPRPPRSDPRKALRAH